MASDDELIGQSIGNYVLKELLGKGGMGSVYLGEHPRIEKQVAVKILSQYVIQQPMAAQRFEAEAKLISRISHPNIIEIFDFGALEDGRLYYIMEMLKGRELRKVMKAKRRMSPKDLLPYLEQICAALQAAHDKGVIHRDLKPENIFVLDGEPMTLKVLDFGVAKLLETDNDVETTGIGVVVGTPLLVAPEQAASKPGLICPATDLYSLGVLLYWILSGRPPFVADAPGILMAMHIMDAPPLITERLPKLPISVARVIHQCLEKDPGLRPGSATEVFDAFSAAVEESEASGEEADPPPMIELSTALDPWGVSGSTGEGAVSGTGEEEVSITGPIQISGTSNGAINLTGPMPARFTGPTPVQLTGPMQAVTPNTTTLGGSSGEVPAAAAVGAHSVLWAVVGVAAALVIMAGGAFLYFQSRERPAALPAAKAPAEMAKKSAPTPIVTPVIVRRIIKISVKGGAAICRFKNREGNIKEIATPCSYETVAGDLVQVKVTSEGLEPYGQSWTANEDLSVDLQIDPVAKKIVTAGTALAASPPAETGTGAGQKVIGKKGHGRRGKKPRKRKGRKPKKKFIPVGEGTMKVDL